MSTLGTMTAGGDPAALGQLLRSRRERLVPADVGLPAVKAPPKKTVDAFQKAINTTFLAQASKA